MSPYDIAISVRQVGQQVINSVNARDLHCYLEVGSAFKDWIVRRIADYGFSEGSDFCSFLSESQGGRPSKEYAISLDMAKELAMVERNEKGKLARKYFIECERQALQAPKQMTHLEILAASSAALVQIERNQTVLAAAQEKNAADMEHMKTLVDQVTESRVWDHCPQNCEPITKIRKRIGDMYGLPGWVIDTVMKGLPLSPKIHGMIKNKHAEALGAHYEVWSVADVTRTFARFIRECNRETEHFASHPDIDRRFGVKAGVVRRQGVAA
jgi:phage anti-repressor protein